MKYILNFKLLFIAALLVFVSCDSKDDDTSFLDDRAAVSYFAPASSGTLLVEEGASRFYDVKVGVSEAKPFSRTYTIMTDPTSEAVEGVDYTLATTNFEIPANAIVGSFRLASGDYESSTLSGKTVKFTLVEVEQSQVLENRSSFTLTVIRFCPIPADYMVGDYQIQDLVGTVGPGNGTSNFAPGVVTISADASDPTLRTFASPVLPAFNSEVETVNLFLSCGNFGMSDVDPGLSCNAGGAPPLYIFSADPDNVPTYDLSDDSSFTITYTEDPNGSCGGPYPASYLLTKL
ncbi:hypothetical protein [Psychroserpens mesophilus]|uniref:hypothetical protein n=1 Tax=Psychroserpens mesophilus TaxID=325473 RepID=UPI000590052E|nr:hypothetical protein [Psychroserpens mesophilus]